MNLRQLEILRAVMRRRTTIGAAHEMGMSQPAVSNAIKHAEAQLGYQLFDRINNRLVPTREAEILFKDSEPLFQLYEAFRRKTRDLTSGRVGRLSILATAELSESVIPRVLQVFQTHHREVHVAIEVLSLDGVLDGLESGLGDVGFAMQPVQRPGLDYEPLHDMEIVCACPVDDPIARLEFVTATDLQERRLIVAPTTGRINAMVQEAFNKASARYAPQVELRFMNIAARLVQAGVGVALVDALTASANRYEGVRFLPFRPRLPLQVWSITTSNRPMSRLAKKFITYTRTGLQEMLQDAGALAAEKEPAGAASGR